MKRQRGDRFEIWFRNFEHNTEKPVQIGYWEDCTWPYRKQAERYAEGLKHSGQGKNGEYFVRRITHDTVGNSVYA